MADLDSVLSLLGRAADTLNADKPNTLDAERVYWARYENAEGQTWETRNPGDRSTRLDIRRIRKPRGHERRELEALNAAGQRDREWERQVLAELEDQRRATIAAEQATRRGQSVGPDVPSSGA